MQILLKSKPLACPRVKRDVQALFHTYGVEPERVHCMGLMAHHNAHLSAYDGIDIALDCWPYAGTVLHKPTLANRGGMCTQ